MAVPPTGLAAPVLPTGAIHVWRLDLDEDGAFDAGCLAPDERERAARFAFEPDRRRFANARAALRTLLGAYAGTAADGIRFIAGPHGKPALERGGLAFNVSHSAGRGAIAVARDLEVGVDVESLPSRADPGTLAPAVFDGEEQGELERAGRGLFAFLVGWTRKEAVLKALGSGLLADPAAIRAGLATDRRRVDVTPLGAHLPPVDVQTVVADGRESLSLAAVGGWSRLDLLDYPAGRPPTP